MMIVTSLLHCKTFQQGGVGHLTLSFREEAASVLMYSSDCNVVCTTVGWWRRKMIWIRGGPIWIALYQT